MLRLVFHGGVGEVGGNKVLLEAGRTRLWMDFGRSFTAGKGFFVNYLQPRRSAGLKDYLEFGLVPRVRGLYSRGLLEGTDLGYEEPGFGGVLVSHAHWDHVGYLEFIDPEIPVHLGEGTLLILEAMEETSPFTRLGSHDYHTFRTGRVLEVGDCQVEPIHVDHSVPAAYGFLVHTDEGTVAYTGDLRAHGPRSDMTEDFVEAAAGAEPVAMVCEGTRLSRIGERRNLSEGEVLEGVRGVLAGASGRPVFFTQPSRDADRWRTFHTAAVESGRVLVVHPRTAYLLDKLTLDPRLDLPDPLRDPHIRVYYKRKRSGTYDDRDYYLWERPYLSRIVTSEEVRSRPGDYLVNLDLYSFAELVDIKPEPGGHFIYSMSEPFNEEGLEEEVLHNWLDHFGLRYHQLHASGHMGRDELRELLDRVSPKAVYPVHTEAPQAFRGLHPRVFLPRLGEPLEVTS